MQARAFGQRRQAPHGALRYVALARFEAMDGILAQAIAQAVDERRKVVLDGATHLEIALLRLQPLHLAPRQAHGFEPVIGAELVEFFLEQAEQMRGIEAGARCPDREALGLAIQPIAGEVQLARSAFVRPQRLRQPLQQ